MLNWRSFLLYISLSIGFVYHGIWNISLEGISWHQLQGHPVYLAYIIGWFEILASIGIYFSRFRLFFLFFLSTTMIGAIAFHLPQGFSFKNNGFETPLLYLFICLSLLIENLPASKIKNFKI